MTDNAAHGGETDELESRLRTLQAQIDEYRRRNGELRLALETLTTIDPVSGIRNRLGILQSIEGALQWNRREGQPFGVVSVRVPALTDLRRREAEDFVEEAIAHVAAVLTAGLRDVDRVGRWDEEAFVAVLAKLDEPGVRPVAPRLASMLSAVPLQGADHVYDLTPHMTALLLEARSEVKAEDLAQAIDASAGSDDPAVPQIVRLGS